MAGLSRRVPTQLKALLFSEKNNHTCTLDAAWHNKMEDDTCGSGPSGSSTRDRPDIS